MYLLLLSPSGSLIKEVLWQYPGEAGPWRLYDYDLLPYAGSTVRLQYGVYNDGYGGVCAMYLDDVSLEICSPVANNREGRIDRKAPE